jgi:hypothetical protein
MPKRSSKQKSEEIREVGDDALEAVGQTAQPQVTDSPGKNPAAVALGKLGGKKWTSPRMVDTQLRV